METRQEDALRMGRHQQNGAAAAYVSHVADAQILTGPPYREIQGRKSCSQCAARKIAARSQGSCMQRRPTFYERIKLSLCFFAVCFLELKVRFNKTVGLITGIFSDQQN
jgi:hypothetical protein